MAIYDQEQDFPSTLTAALGEYHSKGFRIVKFDYILKLYYRDDKVGVLSRGGATASIIREACRNYLESLNARKSLL